MSVDLDCLSHWTGDVVAFTLRFREGADRAHGTFGEVGFDLPDEDARRLYEELGDALKRNEFARTKRHSQPRSNAAPSPGALTASERREPDA